MHIKSTRRIREDSERESETLVPRPVKKKKTNRNENKDKKCLSREEAEELLRQHCRGVWGDSDEEDVKDSRAPQQKDEKKTESQEAVAEETSVTDSRADHPVIRTEVLKTQQKKQKGRATANAHSKEATGSSPPPSDPGGFHKAQGAASIGAIIRHNDMNYHQPNQQQPREQKENKQKKNKTSKRQAKGLRKWSSMRSHKIRVSTSEARPSDEQTPDARPASRVGPRSLQILKEIGGSTSSCVIDRRGPDEAPEQIRKARENKNTQEMKEEQYAEKVFDETVHEIRNMGRALSRTLFL